MTTKKLTSYGTFFTNYSKAQEHALNKYNIGKTKIIAWDCDNNGDTNRWFVTSNHFANKLAAEGYQIEF